MVVYKSHRSYDMFVHGYCSTLDKSFLAESRQQCFVILFAVTSFLHVVSKSCDKGMRTACASQINLITQLRLVVSRRKQGISP